MVDPADLSRLRIRREDAHARTHVRRGPPRWFLATIGLVLLAAAVATVVALRGDPAFDVRVATVAIRGGAGGSAGLTANGYVVARTKASVSSKMPGRLAYLGVEEGDRVQRGSVLARLEAAEYEAVVRQAASQVLAAEATQHEAAAGVAQAERAYARARALDTLIALQTIEDAQTALTLAQARMDAAAARVEAEKQGLAAARANLDNTLIRAPFAGTVLRKDAEVGEVVAPAVAGGGLTRGAVVTMADLTTLEVEVDVNEAYIAQIRDEQPAEVVLDAYPSDRFPGHVRQIVPTADRQKATVLVRVAIDSADPRILPEMGARVFFRQPEGVEGEAELAARITVPAAAVRNEGGQDVVWVVTDGHARRQPVEAGPVMADEREVRRGLQGGEVVVLDPPAELTDGARVRVAGDNRREGSA